jgi:two-component system nitrogen regulation response regulator NtrX
MADLILVVDDDPILREVASEVLGEAGYAVLVARDGAEALEVLARTACDLVLCDVFMPRMDGIETVQAINRRWPDLPVVMLTAGSSYQTPEELLKTTRLMGAKGGFRKPINRATLIPLIRDILAARPQVTTARAAS